jgi:hypothetical protein
VLNLFRLPIATAETNSMYPIKIAVSIVVFYMTAIPLSMRISFLSIAKVGSIIGVRCWNVVRGNRMGAVIIVWIKFSMMLS